MKNFMILVLFIATIGFAGDRGSESVLKKAYIGRLVGIEDPSGGRNPSYKGTSSYASQLGQWIRNKWQAIYDWYWYSKLKEAYINRVVDTEDPSGTGRDVYRR